MRRFAAVLVCVFSLLCSARSPGLGAPKPPEVSCPSAILVDAATGKVLYEKGCRTRRPPASTTKIMTAILILENGDLDDKVTASARACETRYGSLHLKPGETLTMKDLLYAIILRSANDAAVCAAEHIAGSEEKFVELMNEKAVEIGAEDTHFANPHGLYDGKHYSTAYDLALIARYAADMPEFNKIVRTRVTRIERSMERDDVVLKNTARFLWRFDGADGIKTGYTREAGHCFVGSATRGGWRLISVVLKSDDAGRDTTGLLIYGFKYFKQVSFARKGGVVTRAPVAGGVVKEIGLVAGDHLALVTRKSANVRARRELSVKKAVAPIVKGEKLGRLTGYVNGGKLGSVDLLASKEVRRTLAAKIWTWTRSILTVSVVFVLGYLAYGTAVAKAARRSRRGVKARS